MGTSTSFISFLICLWLLIFISFDGHSYFAQATSPVPAQLPSAFTSAQTLNKLRADLCGSCSQHRRDRLRYECREYKKNDVCYLLCGCSNYGKKCLSEGLCACQLTFDEGCPRSQTLCVFDDALICSTPNNICMYYDEKQIHCECRDGWTGENCNSDAKKSLDPPPAPPVAGSDLTVKVLVIACAVCLILGIILGVFCTCRSGKLVCISTSRVEQVEKKDKTQERKANSPATRQHSDHAYCHIIQYAVPDTATSQPNTDIPRNVGYAEPNTKYQQSSTRQRREEGNYYFKLEPSSSPVTYESVSPKESRSDVTLIHKIEDEMSSFDVINPEPGHKSGNRELKCNPCSSDEYDHLKRQVDVNIIDTSKNYSHLALQEFL